MKTHRIIGLLVAIIVLAACSSSDEESILELSPIKKQMNITFVDYAQLPEGSEPSKLRYFSKDYPADDYLIPWLKSRFWNLLPGSTATIDYDYKRGDREDKVGKFDHELIKLSNEDYKEIWGVPYIRALSPKHSPGKELPSLLKKKLPQAKEGDFQMVSYDYSEEDPTVESDVLISYFHEDFTNLKSLVGHPNWFNMITNTGGRIWGIRSYGDVYQAMLTINGGSYNTEYETWLITKKIDLGQAEAPEFSFDIAAGYYTEHCIQVLVSTDYVGGGNPKNAQWEDLTDLFDIPREGPAGYGRLKPAGKVVLDKYAGKEISIAFYFKGKLDSTLERCTTYELDNISVAERGDLLKGSEVKRQHRLFEYDGKSWLLVDTPAYFIAQPADYEFLKVNHIDPQSAYKLIPRVLQKNNIPISVDQLTVIYLRGSTSVYADAYQFGETGWIQMTNYPFITKRSIYQLESDGVTWVNVESKE